MRVSKELIEKYHNGLCSSDEKKAVEAWLFDDESTAEPAFPLPDRESKIRLQDEMWQEISTVLPSQQKPRLVIFLGSFWQQAAAILLVALTGITAIYLRNQSADKGVIVLNNTSETTNKDLQEDTYSLSVGPKSNVEINSRTGRIEFCGTMMINPERDIELTIRGMCTHPDGASEKMILKKGQKYIALHHGNASSADEVIILSQGSLTGLPPLMQRNLMMQFNI